MKHSNSVAQQQGKYQPSSPVEDYTKNTLANAIHFIVICMLEITSSTQLKYSLLVPISVQSLNKALSINNVKGVGHHS